MHRRVAQIDRRVVAALLVERLVRRDALAQPVRRQHARVRPAQRHVEPDAVDERRSRDDRDQQRYRRPRGQPCPRGDPAPTMPDGDRGEETDNRDNRQQVPEEHLATAAERYVGRGGERGGRHGACSVVPRQRNHTCDRRQTRCQADAERERSREVIRPAEPEVVAVAGGEVPKIEPQIGEERARVDGRIRRPGKESADEGGGENAPTGSHMPRAWPPSGVSGSARQAGPRPSRRRQPPRCTSWKRRDRRRGPMRQTTGADGCSRRRPQPRRLRGRAAPATPSRAAS